MKKALLVLLLVSIIIISGCSQKETSKTPTATPKTSTNAVTPSVTPTTQPAKTDIVASPSQSTEPDKPLLAFETGFDSKVAASITGLAPGKSAPNTATVSGKIADTAVTAKLVDIYSTVAGQFGVGNNFVERFLGPEAAGGSAGIGSFFMLGQALYTATSITITTSMGLQSENTQQKFIEFKLARGDGSNEKTYMAEAVEKDGGYFKAQTEVDGISARAYKIGESFVLDFGEKTDPIKYPTEIGSFTVEPDYQTGVVKINFENAFWINFKTSSSGELVAEPSKTGKISNFGTVVQKENKIEIYK